MIELLLLAVTRVSTSLRGVEEINESFAATERGEIKRGYGLQ